MEQIIKHFSEAADEFIIAFLMLILVFTGIQDATGHTGALSIIGGSFNYTEFNYRDFNDFKGVISESQKTLPVVTYDLSQPEIFAGEDILLTNYIKATDRNGTDLNIKVKKILKDDVDVTDLYNTDTKIVNFTTSGVYEVYVSATDDTMRVQNKKIEIPVNRR